MGTLLAASSFSDQLNNLFTADWVLAIFIFLSVLILLSAVFKRRKTAIGLLIAAVCIAAGFVLAAFILMLIAWDTLSLIDFAIRWLPTALFVFIITVSTLINAKRGLRKSLILLAHAVGACTVCIVFFYVCVNSEWVDRTILSLINGFMGGSSLQSALGVSADCTTLREILAEYLPTLFGGDLQILLAHNPQYIISLADMGFRIVFALITLLLYFFLIFILYLIYLAAYSESRYKEKKNRAALENKTGRPYKKRHLAGGAVGLVRGIAVGLLSLSFMGSAFFIAAGGTGSGTLGDYDLGNSEYNYYYSLYRSIESYGSQGIFKILNMMTDPGDTPFYLFAADMVLSGNLDTDELEGQNIKFREELGAYLGFAKDTINLLLKYGQDDIAAVLNGTAGEGAFDTVLNIMVIPEFRTEFDLLIEEFDAKTYVVNLGMSLIGSIAESVDELSFTADMSEGNKELMKLLFKEGYLSDDIPDEHKLKKEIGDGALKESQIPPTVKVSHLINKKDVRIMLQVALSILAGEQQTEDTLALIKDLLPEIKQLSILETSRASELDPVLARLYCFVENRYLTAENEEGRTYKSVADKHIRWLDEINVLLDVAVDSLALRENLEAVEGIREKALAIFDTASPDYDENVEYFDRIRFALERSDIIGTALSTSYIFNIIKEATATVSENFYLPENLNYTRTETADGDVHMGEVYYFLGGFRLFNAPENRGLSEKIIGGDEDISVGMLDELAVASTTIDDEGNKLSYYFTESYLLRSLLSIVLIERGAGTVYVPLSSLDRSADGEPVNMIHVEELKQLLDNLTELADFVRPLVEIENGGAGEDESESDNDETGDENPGGGSEDETPEIDSDTSARIALIAEALRREGFAALVETNRIFEGTVALFLSDLIDGNPYVVIPWSLIAGVDGWVTTETSYKSTKGELRNLLDALAAASVDLEQLFGGEYGADALIDTLISFDRERADEFLSSQILHYTLSSTLIEGTSAGGISVIVPHVARTRAQEEDDIEFIVRKSELLELFAALSAFNLSEGSDASSLLYKIVANKGMFETSSIMAASVIAMLVNEKIGISTVLSIPEAYVAAGAPEAIVDYNSANIWRTELPRFVDALDVMFGISAAGEGFTFDAETVQRNLSSLITDLNAGLESRPGHTKLTLCYLSDIARNVIAVYLDRVLKDLVDESVLDDARAHGYYKREELEAFSNALREMGITDFDSLADFDVLALIAGIDEPSSLDPGKTKREVIFASHLAAGVIERKLSSLLPEGF